MPRFTCPSLVVAAVFCLSNVFLLSSASSVQAESQTFYSSELLGPISQPDSIAFASFNTDLGTLQSVSVTLKFNLCPQVNVDNSTTAPIQFNNLVITAPFAVTGPGGLTYNSTLSTKSLSGTATAGSNSFVPNVGWIYAVEGFHSTDLASWEGMSGETINLVVTPGELIKTSGNLPAGLNVTSTALEWENISVKYTYLSSASVPEPSGKYLASIVGILMVLFVIGRRMRLAA